MKCTSCSAEVPASAKFCPECGAKIVRKSFCPECGAEAAPGAKFCAECGTKLVGGPVARKAELAVLSARPEPEARPYEPAPLDTTPRPSGNFNLVVGPVYIKEQMLRIANAEGPITDGLLFARVLEEWGIRCATENKIKVLEKSIPPELPVTEHSEGKTYWPVDADPSEWHFYRVPGASQRSHRTFAQIPLEELAAAIAAEHRAAVAAGGTVTADPYPGAVERLGLPRRVVVDTMKPKLDAAKRLAQNFYDLPSED